MLIAAEKVPAEEEIKNSRFRPMNKSVVTVVGDLPNIIIVGRFLF